MQAMSQKRKGLLSRENIGILIGTIIAVALAIIADDRGMPHKWHTAIFGTVVPFGVVLLGTRLMWRRWSFWAALTICLAIHTLAMWFFFKNVLSNAQDIGLLLWFPIAVIEIFVLVVAVKRIEEKLTGKKETYILD